MYKSSICIQSIMSHSLAWCSQERLANNVPCGSLISVNGGGDGRECNVPVLVLPLSLDVDALPIFLDATE